MNQFRIEYYEDRIEIKECHFSQFEYLNLVKTFEYEEHEYFLWFENEEEIPLYINYFLDYDLLYSLKCGKQNSKMSGKFVEVIWTYNHKNNQP